MCVCGGCPRLCSSLQVDSFTQKPGVTWNAGDESDYSPWSCRLEGCCGDAVGQNGLTDLKPPSLKPELLSRPGMVVFFHCLLIDIDCGINNNSRRGIFYNDYWSFSYLSTGTKPINLTFRLTFHVTFRALPPPSSCNFGWLLRWAGPIRQLRLRNESLRLQQNVWYNTFPSRHLWFLTSDFWFIYLFIHFSSNMENTFFFHLLKFTALEFTMSSRRPCCNCHYPAPRYSISHSLFIIPLKLLLQVFFTWFKISGHHWGFFCFCD